MPTYKAYLFHVFYVEISILKNKQTNKQTNKQKQNKKKKKTKQNKTAHVVFLLKGLMPITFSSPRAQPEVVYFLVLNESPYFSNCKSEISPSNSL